MKTLTLTNGTNTVSVNLNTQGAAGVVVRNSMRRNVRAGVRSPLARGMMTAGNMRNIQSIGSVSPRTKQEIQGYLNQGYKPATQEDAKLLREI